jgi:hypothetical protein
MNLVAGRDLGPDPGLPLGHDREEEADLVDNLFEAVRAEPFPASPIFETEKRPFS